MFLAKGTEYFNPDEASRRNRSVKASLSEAEANSEAWNQGKRLLQRVITQRLNFAFETTLAGNTIPALLSSALSAGLDVRIWYAGLSGIELHVARVRARVEKGGHAIPEQNIRDRYDLSRLKLMAWGRMVNSCALQSIPKWAKPIVAAALKRAGRHVPKR